MLFRKGYLFSLLLKSFFYQDRIPKNLKSTSEMHTWPLPTPISTIWKQYSRCTSKREKKYGHTYVCICKPSIQAACFFFECSILLTPSISLQPSGPVCISFWEPPPFTFFSCYARWTNRKKYISESKSGG